MPRSVLKGGSVPRGTRDRNGIRTASARSSWYRHLFRDETGVGLVLVVLVAAIGIARPDFLAPDNLLTTAHNSVYIGLMACGMAFALAMREVDLSVGGTYALTVVVGAWLVKHGFDSWIAAVAILALAALLGSINAIITTYARLPSFIVTLASAMLFRGMGLALAGGKQISGLPSHDVLLDWLGGDVAGVASAVWILLAATIVLAVVFTRTRFGAQVRAIGSNPDAAEFSGLPTTKTRIKALALSGFMAGLAGLLALGFYSAGDPTIGNGYELNAIAAAIIGGTPLAGGRGSVPGAMIGSLILSVVAAALVFFGVPINWTTFATGGVILLAVAFDSLLRRYREQRRTRKGFT